MKSSVFPGPWASSSQTRRSCAISEEHILPIPGTSLFFLNRPAHHCFYSIPEEVRLEVQAIEGEYLRSERDVLQKSSGRPYPDDAIALKEIQDRRLEELSGVLSLAELSEYEVRNGKYSRRLSRDLASFKPTEEEFRTIFELLNAFETEFGFRAYDFNDPNFRR